MYQVMKLVKAILLTEMLLICVTGNNKAGTGNLKQDNNQNIILHKHCTCD